MTHLLPRGKVPRLHGARSPVPPRLPHFATPRSVHPSAAVAAGTCPLRRPPNAWSPGAPAPPGLCYWLVASGTPVRWCGGCLAVGMVRGAVRHYCLGGCSALIVCARRSQLVRQAWVPSGCPLSSLAGTLFHAVCAFVGCPSGTTRVSFVCVCARAPAAPAPPPLPSFVWRAHFARSRCWALVGPFHTVRAPPRVLPRSPAPFGLLRGGGGPVPFPPLLAAGCALPVGWVCASGTF